MEFLGTLPKGRQIYVVRYAPGFLGVVERDWSGFDAMLVVYGETISDEVVRDLATQLSKGPVRTVATIGPDWSRRQEDLFFQVLPCRLVLWSEWPPTFGELVRHAAHCWTGECDRGLLVVVGTEAQSMALSAGVRKELSPPRT